VEFAPVEPDRSLPERITQALTAVRGSCYGSRSDDGDFLTEGPSECHFCPMTTKSKKANKPKKRTSKRSKSTQTKSASGGKKRGSKPKQLKSTSQEAAGGGSGTCW
jgi:hypothetical protein